VILTGIGDDSARGVLDQLKIDRAFVRDMLADAASNAIAQAIVSLSRAMHLSLLAEGVETEEQRASLDDLGCHAYQGYLFSPPVPVERFPSLLKAKRRAARPKVLAWDANSRRR
jgi:EAL domain-containing protein (putative c-di-GMP-specific phosphodiesterase class I)